MALKREVTFEALFNNFYTLLSSAMFHYCILVLLSVMAIISTNNFLLTNFATSCTMF